VIGLNDPLKVERRGKRRRTARLQREGARRGSHHDTLGGLSMSLPLSDCEMSFNHLLGGSSSEALHVTRGVVEVREIDREIDRQRRQRHT
jgi:hypothetical protein